MSELPITVTPEIHAYYHEGQNHTKLWLGLRPDTSEAEARAKFREIHRAEPAEVKFTGGAVLVGPIPD